MPIPAYIVLSESGAIDSHTNRTSMFDFIEVLQVKKTGDAQQQQSQKAPQQSPKAKTYRLVASWMKEESDSPDDEFDMEIVCLAPDGAKLMHTETDRFKFVLSSHRYYIPEIPVPGFNVLGIHFFEARLKRAASSEWQWKQSYPILVKEIPVV